MTFKIIEDSIENALDIADSLLSLEAPKKKQVAKLISDGLSVYAISEITGLATDIIEKVMESENG